MLTINSRLPLVRNSHVREPRRSMGIFTPRFPHLGHVPRASAILHLREEDPRVEQV